MRTNVESSSNFVGRLSERLDREWFAANLGTWIMVREARLGEFPPPSIPFVGKAEFVIVILEENGSITRRNVWAFEKPPSDMASLAVISDLVAEAYSDGVVGEVPSEKVRAAERKIDHLHRRERLLANRQIKTALRAARLTGTFHV